MTWRQRLYFPPSSLPQTSLFPVCTHELPCIQSGQCWVSASLLTPESFGKPSRKLSVWGVTKGGEEERDREGEGEGGGDVHKASRGWLSNLFSFLELSRQCPFSYSSKMLPTPFYRFRISSFIFYLVNLLFNILPRVVLYYSPQHYCGGKLSWSDLAHFISPSFITLWCTLCKMVKNIYSLQPYS